MSVVAVLCSVYCSKLNDCIELELGYPFSFHMKQDEGTINIITIIMVSLLPTGTIV